MFYYHAKHSVLLFTDAFLNNVATKFHQLLSQYQWFYLFQHEIIDDIATHNQNSHSLWLYNFTENHPSKKHALFTLILARHYQMEHTHFSHGNNLPINLSDSYFHAKHDAQSDACNEHIIIIAFQRL